MMNRLLLLLTGCMLLTQAQSQSGKQLALADEYFASGDYFTAAGLYGQYLNPGMKSKKSSGFPLNAKRKSGRPGGAYENNTDILFRQAESYRLANYSTEAAALYQQCFENDATKYNVALYWFAVCQRSTGNYKVAEESIDRFLKEYAAGNSYKQAASEEKQRLQFIKSQLSRPDSNLFHIQKLNSPVGTAKGIFAVSETMAGKFIISSTQKDSVASGINPYHNRLFTSVLTDGSLQNVQPVTIEMNDVSVNQGAASISVDGSYLYFTQWKKEQGHVISSIYYSGKTANGWGQPRLLASVNQQGHNSRQPFCSPDRKYLFFASDRKGGLGNFDIWFAPLQPDGTTGVAINAGAGLNTSSNEQSPFYHQATGTLVFSSDRMPGMGGYDLFTSRGSLSEWMTPKNMGYPVNSSRDDVYFFTSGKGNLLDNAFLSSDRGSDCCLSTYVVSKSSNNKLVTGLVRDCKNNEPVSDAEVIMKDGSGKTLQTTTTLDGKFSFELTVPDGHSLLIRKEKYNEKTADILITAGNEANSISDTLYHAVLCMEKKLVIKMEDVVTVYFDYNESRLKEIVMAKLDSIYKVLINDSMAFIQISGYSDDIGSVEYNLKLSDKRARACTDYLINKGIDARRISFASFGACCPVEMELINGRDNRDAKSQDRRALIHISRE